MKIGSTGGPNGDGFITGHLNYDYNNPETGPDGVTLNVLEYIQFMIEIYQELGLNTVCDNENGILTIIRPTDEIDGTFNGNNLVWSDPAGANNAPTSVPYVITAGQNNVSGNTGNAWYTSVGLQFYHPTWLINSNRLGWGMPTSDSPYLDQASHWLTLMHCSIAYVDPSREYQSYTFETLF